MNDSSFLYASESNVAAAEGEEVEEESLKVLEIEQDLIKEEVV